MFLATYGEYPSLYDLLDTPKHILVSLQQHLHNSTFPRLLLLWSRGPPTLQNEPVAVKPNLASSTPSVHHVTHLSITPSIHHATYPSITMSVCHMKHLSDCPSESLSLSDHMHSTMPHPSTCPSSTMTDHPSTPSQCLPVMNQEQSCPVKRFYWAFPSYELLLSASSHVDSSKSGEDPCKTCEIMGDCRILGLTALNSLLQYVNWLVWEVCSVN